MADKRTRSVQDQAGSDTSTQGPAKLYSRRFPDAGGPIGVEEEPRFGLDLDGLINRHRNWGTPDIIILTCLKTRWAKVRDEQPDRVKARERAERAGRAT